MAGMDRFGLVMNGIWWHVMVRQERYGEEWFGADWRGKDWSGWAWQARQGVDWKGWARIGKER